MTARVFLDGATRRLGPCNLLCCARSSAVRVPVFAVDERERKRKRKMKKECRNGKRKRKKENEGVGDEGALFERRTTDAQRRSV